MKIIFSENFSLQRLYKYNKLFNSNVMLLYYMLGWVLINDGIENILTMFMII